MFTCMSIPSGNSIDSLVGDCKRLLSLSILMVIRENVSTNVKGQNEFPVTVFGIAGGKLDCQPRGKATSACPSQRHVTEGYIIVYTTKCT